MSSPDPPTPMKTMQTLRAFRAFRAATIAATIATATAPAPAQTDQPRDQPRDEAREEAPDRRRTRVLILEDDADRGAMRERLRRELDELRLPEATRDRIREAIERANRELEVPGWPGPGAGWAEGEAPFRIGIVCNPLGEALRAHVDLPEGVGMVVSRILDGSPAARAGIRRNDILVAADGRRIESFESLVDSVQAAGRERRPLELELRRAGEAMAVVVHLDQPQPEPGRDRPGARDERPRDPGPPERRLSEQDAQIREMRERIDRQQRSIEELRDQLAEQREAMADLRRRLERPRRPAAPAPDSGDRR